MEPKAGGAARKEIIGAVAKSGAGPRKEAAKASTGAPADPKAGTAAVTKAAEPAVVPPVAKDPGGGAGADVTAKTAALVVKAPTVKTTPAKQTKPEVALVKAAPAKSSQPASDPAAPTVAGVSDALPQSELESTETEKTDLPSVAGEDDKKFTLMLLQWLEQLRWPYDEESPLNRKVGVSWAELALSWMLFFQQCLPIIRKANDGSSRVIQPASAASAEAWGCRLRRPGSHARH